MSKKGTLTIHMSDKKALKYDSDLEVVFEKAKKEYFQSASDAGVEPKVVLDTENKYEFITILGEKLTIEMEIEEENEKSSD